MNDTVVYRHLKPNGEVFYVGIGCEKRPYSKHHRSKWWKNIVKKYPDYGVEVVATGLSWDDACELEELMISEYGRRDLGLGTLVNMTNGGEGCYGLVHSEETKQKIGAANKGKKHSLESKQKMSAAKSGENAPWFGKKLSKETRQKLSAANSGKNHPMYGKPALNRKLTFKKAEEIRRRYKTEKITQQKLAQEYGVSRRTIGRIIQNKRYTK